VFLVTDTINMVWIRLMCKDHSHGGAILAMSVNNPYLTQVLKRLRAVGKLKIVNKNDPITFILGLFSELFV
jgi:hypothetical protein